MGVVGLGPADGDPVAHGAEAAHAAALVPVGAVHLAADGALGGDDASTPLKGIRLAAGAEGAVGRAYSEDGGVGGEAAAALDDALEHCGVALFGPVAVAGFVGAVGEDDERGVESASKCCWRVSFQRRKREASAPLMPAASSVTPADFRWRGRGGGRGPGRWSGFEVMGAG